MSFAKTLFSIIAISKLKNRNSIIVTRDAIFFNKILVKKTIIYCNNLRLLKNLLSNFIYIFKNCITLLLIKKEKKEFFSN